MEQIEKVARILRVARSWLGTPYQHQASLKGVGCDCLGLVRGIWREVEGKEPESTPAYSSTWAEVNSREQLLDASSRHFAEVPTMAIQLGDVIVFRIRPRSAAKHMGILSETNKFIHAYDGNSVVESGLSNFWKQRIAGVFRFPCVVKGGAK